MSKELDEAAVVYMEEGFSYETSPIEHFKAGALWAEKHSPKVLALIKALEWYATPGIHERWRAEEALANFRGGEGE